MYALHPANGRYYKAIVVELADQKLCKLTFQDGTFSRDTPSDCILVSFPSTVSANTNTKAHLQLIYILILDNY